MKLHNKTINIYQQPKFNITVMSKDNINKVELYHYSNQWLSALNPLPESPIVITFKNYNWTINFDRIDNLNWLIRSII